MKMQEKIMHRLWQANTHIRFDSSQHYCIVEITTARVVNDFIYRTNKMKCWTAIHAAHRRCIHIDDWVSAQGIVFVCVCVCSVIKAELLYKCTYLLRIVYSTLFAALLVTTPINAHIILKASSKKPIISYQPYSVHRAATSLEFM